MIRRAKSNRTIVFDLDDTLYLEADFVHSGFGAVDRELQRRGIQGFEPAASSLFRDGIRGTIFDQALRQLGVDHSPDLIAELVAVYRSHLPRLKLLPDAQWALSHYGSTAQLSLLTDGYADTQRNKVRALDIEKHFAACVFTDDLGRDCWKPSAVPFRKVSELLQSNGSPNSFVYVADNPKKDFVAPNQLGWQTIRIRRPDGEYSKFEAVEDSHGAHFAITTLESLPEILGE